MGGMQSAFLTFFGIILVAGVVLGGVIVGLFWLFS